MRNIISYKFCLKWNFISSFQLWMIQENLLSPHGRVKWPSYVKYNTTNIILLQIFFLLKTPCDGFTQYGVRSDIFNVKFRWNWIRCWIVICNVIILSVKCSIAFYAVDGPEILPPQASSPRPSTSCMSTVIFLLIYNIKIYQKSKVNRIWWDVSKPFFLRRLTDRWKIIWFNGIQKLLRREIFS